MFGSEFAYSMHFCWHMTKRSVRRQLNLVEKTHEANMVGNVKVIMLNKMNTSKKIHQLEKITDDMIQTSIVEHDALEENSEFKCEEVLTNVKLA